MTRTAKQKILGSIAIIFGLCSMINSISWLYRYSDPNIYWLYVIPTYKLVIGFVLGLISFLNGLLLIYANKRIYFPGSIISIALILLHWILFVEMLT